MASQDDVLSMDYDTDSDVLYASLGPPQASLSYEIVKDIWLDYVPPNRAVIGITVINFLRHYPVEDRTQLLSAGTAVVKTLLERYPSVPLDEELQTINAQTSYVQSITIAVQGTTSSKTTLYVGGVALTQSPRIQSSPLSQGAPAL
jgi:uncharacterized protein YuzE